ncbi:hypothetical protein KI659_17890 [Litoribacter alkaliphilus]|uniref:Uncharacterized protein n=1 Tax=Litoribacter ruber TaxID=702568 RepID=A0AAP2CQ64_9BACT|nr:hypothetical protein [Litoribacter alkaliphilus]MBS9525897.1 hypothetical protein [Litoribacter alkaliphilus]
MKKILLTIGLVLLYLSVFGQSPQTMSYQAVIRNSKNELVANSTVSMRISIIQGSEIGEAVYIETQRINTNHNGLLSIAIGNGSVVEGNFGQIAWGSGPFFLKSETDVNGGTNYDVIGIIQLMSVPYALYAEQTGQASSVHWLNIIGGPSIEDLRGEKGDPGVGTNIIGSVETQHRLPQAYEGEIGNVYLVKDSGHGWMWDGTEFIDVGLIQGPKGETGPQGLSAFEVWKGIDENSQKTFDDYVEALKGKDGLSAFELWRMQSGNSNKGITDFYNSMVGEKGDPGVGTRIVGSLATEEDLQHNYRGEIGDVFVAQDSGYGWMWDGEGFINVGPIRGPQGERGKEGFSAFEVWTHIPGNEEKSLDEYLIAIKGDKGDTGAGTKIVGVVETEKDLPIFHFGEVGDLFMVSETGHAWMWDGIGYVDVGNIRGPQGEKGEKGEAFAFEDLTEAQRESLRGAQGLSAFQEWSLLPGNEEKGFDVFISELRGEDGKSFGFEDFTPEQLASLQGAPGEDGKAFKYEDFTSEQLAS